MPKLDNAPMKEMFGLTVDKENDNVIYNDERHCYLSKKDGSPYISVTTLIHNYAQAFDKDFWASYKACEQLLGSDFADLKRVLLSTKKWKDEYFEKYGIVEVNFNDKKQEILDQYKRAADDSCIRGTAIHAKMENALYALEPSHVKKYAGGGKFECKKGYYKLDLERAIYPEFFISYEFDEYLKVAGQVDLAIIDGNDVSIIDWKTNRRIDKESFYDRNTKKRQMMKYPLDNIQDTNFWHYSLQLSLYAYLFQQINPKYKIKKLAIVHFDHDGNETEYEVEYLKEDVARMLLHYRRQNKIKLQLDMDKPIEF